MHAMMSPQSPAHLPCDAAAAERTLVMGILNVTPDSFSDGGEHYAANDALIHAQRMIAQGADIIDVGGESTRPGAVRISVDEELRRILPVIEGLAETGITISVDTMNAATARAAVAAGAHIINDVSGMSVSDEMIQTVAELGVPYILMHARGTSTTMDALAAYPRGTVTEVLDELAALRDRLVAAGVHAENIILDPGLGFAKGGMQDWELLAALGQLHALGHRVLIAGSRKRFLANALNAADAACTKTQNPAAGANTAPDQMPPARAPEDRDAASAALSALVAAQGVWGIRVHNVPPTVDAVTVANTLRTVTRTNQT